MWGLYRAIGIATLVVILSNWVCDIWVYRFSIPAPASTYPLNLGGDISHPEFQNSKFKGRSVQNHLFYSVFAVPPPP